MKNLSQRSRQRGLTLIEILVATLVLAIGLLGIAAMQLRGLQYNHDSHIRSQVAILAAGMADRMRNASDPSAYTSDFTLQATEPTGCVIASTVATQELACWYREVWKSLPPRSQAIISLSGTEYTISLQPYDRTQDALGPLISYSFSL